MTPRELIATELKNDQLSIHYSVFLSSRDPCFDTLPPGVKIGNNFLLAGCVHEGCFEVALHGVFEEQQRSTGSTGAIAQFSSENLSWLTLRLYAEDLSKPAEASLNEHRGYAQETVGLKALSVWD